MSSRTASHKGLTGKHVAVALVGFFVAIFLVNGIFVYVSLNSHPGVTSEDAYREGLQFNRRLDAADRQSAQGWNVRVDATRRAVEVAITDAGDKPVSGLTVTMNVRRPVHDGADQTVLLKEDSSGVYVADRLALSTGRWSFVFLAKSQGRIRYRLEHSEWFRK